MRVRILPAVMGVTLGLAACGGQPPQPVQTPPPATSAAVTTSVAAAPPVPEDTKPPTTAAAPVTYSCGMLGLATIDTRMSQLAFIGGPMNHYPGEGEVCDVRNEPFPPGLVSCIAGQQLGRWPQCRPPIWMCSSAEGEIGAVLCYPFQHTNASPKPAGG